MTSMLNIIAASRRRTPPPSGGLTDFALLNNYALTESVTTSTVTAASLGTADAARRIIVAVGARAGSPRSINSITVGGVSATLYQGTSNGSCVGFGIAHVPTGTTGDVVVVFSGGIVARLIQVYRVIGAPGTVATARYSGSANVDISANTGANGFAVAILAGAGSNTVDTIWTGITDNFDGTMTPDNVPAARYASAAAIATTTAETPRAMEYDTTATSVQVQTLIAY